MNKCRQIIEVISSKFFTCLPAQIWFGVPFQARARLSDFEISYILNLLSESESVKFSLIESVIFLFTDSSVKKISLLNHLIFTDLSVKFDWFTVISF